MNTFVQDHHSLAAHGDQAGEGQGKAHHIHHLQHHKDQMGSHSQYQLTQLSKDGFSILNINGKFDTKYL